MNTHLLAAPAAAGANGAQFFGTVGLSAIALSLGAVVIMAIRGRSGPVKRVISDNRRLAALAAVFGIACIIAGGTWQVIATGVHGLSASTLAEPEVTGGIPPAGVALVLTVLTWLPEWQKRIPPTFLGIGAGVSWGIAGAYWGIVYKLIAAMLEKLA
ncbi:hypothetical protein RCO28_34440 [Streptomyces sp. LHD-70]|uniref:hypothetical protein n=1 Tax=Streptomyces sp. LHD-70 TaxID=3072140 RepID=UPI00280FB92F|nr:hypothetical protein [Streptomyces sp. LHD-70]MDQ8707532.1 hypothetical protein [Streptomyces sp. LHD-70]